MQDFQEWARPPPVLSQGLWLLLCICWDAWAAAASSANLTQWNGFAQLGLLDCCDVASYFVLRATEPINLSNLAAFERETSPKL